MSSARLPLALAVLGLAACAHTPSTTAYILPDIRHAAPVTVKSSSDVPEGFDDHVVVSIDRDGLRHAQQQAALAPYNSRYYYYGHPATRSSSPAVATTPSGQRPAIRSVSSVSSTSAVPVGPRQSGKYDTRRSHD